MLGKFSNVQYIEGCSDIEHLAVMSQFKNFIIANSSFSWWGAKLSELYHGEKNVHVIRPNCLFQGDLAKTCTGNNFYPIRWKKKELYKIVKGSGKIDLKDVTFIIPVKYDHKDRLENVNHVINLINKYFDTNIIIGEQGGTYFEYLRNYVSKYIPINNMPFHRTRIINMLVMEASTPIIFNWDADVVTYPEQIFECVKYLRQDIDIAFPYNKTFVHIDRCNINSVLAHIDKRNKNHIDLNRFLSQQSVGGAIGFNKDSFIKSGMENENFEIYGFEDLERICRYTKLGLKIKYTEGVLFHLDHFRGKYSNIRNSNTVINKSEYNKVNNMSKKELENYILTWPWIWKKTN